MRASRALKLRAQQNATLRSAVVLINPLSSVVSALSLMNDTIASQNVILALLSENQWSS